MKHRGFTLIELMVTLAILGVLLSLALPSFRTFIGQQRLKAASFELQSALLMARSEAIKRGVSGVVTVSAVDATNWGKGWKSTVGAVDIAQQGGFDEVSIVGTADSVIYNGDGRATVVDFSLSIPGEAKVLGRCVRVDVTGMPYSKVAAGGGC